MNKKIFLFPLLFSQNLFCADADPNRDIRKCLGWSTPLLEAIYPPRNKTSIVNVQALLAQNADPNTPSKNGGLPLVRAVYLMNKEVVEALMAANANVDGIDSSTYDEKTENCCRDLTPLAMALLRERLERNGAPEGYGREHSEEHIQAITGLLVQHGASTAHPSVVAELEKLKASQ